MKKVITYLFLVFTFNAFSAENIFEKADSLYQLSQYENAINQYSLILEKGLESSSVYYNLGICYFQLERYSKSKNYFKKCLILNPENTKCIENINLCDIKTLKKEAPRFFYVEWRNSFLNLFSLTFLYLFSLTLLSTILTLILLSIVKKKKIPKYIFVILLIVNILFFLTIQLKEAENQNIFNKYSSNISFNK